MSLFDKCCIVLIMCNDYRNFCFFICWSYYEDCFNVFGVGQFYLSSIKLLKLILK